MSPADTFLPVSILRSRATLALCVLLSISGSVRATNPFTGYAVDFPDPNAVTAGDFSGRFAGAVATIVQWAEDRTALGPWSVTNKPVVAPSGDKHDYMSWAPYQWPDCSKAGNTTVLSPPDMWKTCAYVFRDGQVNPDRETIRDFQAFSNLSDAVLYNSIAAVLQNSSSSIYSKNVAKFISTWFLDADTAMNPNLNYAQMNRGPNGQHGAYTGILDLRGFAKIASGILMLRKSGNTDWTPTLDGQLIAWSNQYINWLQTSALGKQAGSSTNNHGTIFINQLAGLKLIVEDVASAITLTEGYFAGIYKGQVTANGDQPMEANRTHPYHYRNFNIAGMITNARILTYADPSAKPWNATANGATIQTTLDFLMTTDPAAKAEQDNVAEIYPNVAAIASVYGDPSGKYVKFLNASGFAYAEDASFLWDQPLAGGDASAASTSGVGAPSGAIAATVGRSARMCLFSLIFLSLGRQFW
ncbi:chondroitin AC/alginate lyase [Mycena vulgaris]|nr:chondroitin AC/alginate lyase [Mycena vulgaris]